MIDFLNNEVIFFVYSAQSFKRKAGNEFKASLIAGLFYMGFRMDLIGLQELFERQIKRKVKSIDLSRERDSTFRFLVERETISKYSDPGTQLLWEIYYAGANDAKKKMKINLPNLKEKPENFYDAGYNEGIKDCKKHLIALQFTVVDK